MVSRPESRKRPCQSLVRHLAAFLLEVARAPPHPIGCTPRCEALVPAAKRTVQVVFGSRDFRRFRAVVAMIDVLPRNIACAHIRPRRSETAAT